MTSSKVEHEVSSRTSPQKELPPKLELAGPAGSVVASEVFDLATTTNIQAPTIEIPMEPAGVAASEVQDLSGTVKVDVEGGRLAPPPLATPAHSDVDMIYDDGEHSGQDEGEDGDGDDDDNSSRSVVRVVIPNPALSDVRSPAVEGDTHGNQGRPHSPSAMLAHKAMRMDLSDMHWSGSPPPTPLVGAVNAGAQSSAALGDRGDRPSLTAPATMAKPGSGSSTRRGRTEAGLEGEIGRAHV